MRITEIQIFTDDLEETKRFYTTVLELEMIIRQKNSISFSAGQSVLTFIKSPVQKPVYHFAFNIPNNKMGEAVSWLSNKTKIIDASETQIIADFKAWNAKAVYFFDNNGNILEFIARFDLGNKSDLPFSGCSIQCLSEIAIVTDDVKTLTDKLVSEIKIPAFSKQPVLQNFAAMGDDNGLIIISETDRHWFPTEIRAKRYYAKIKISINNLVKEIVSDNEVFTCN